jgi:UDPglucose 6-dehydrogenase
MSDSYQSSGSGKLPEQQSCGLYSELPRSRSWAKGFKIAIVGSGIVGTATVLSLAKNTQNKVEVYDVSLDQERKAERLLGASPWNLNDITFHPKLDKAVEGADAVMVCVPTPISEDYKPYDYTIIDEIVQNIAKATKAPIIVRSTVDPIWLRKTTGSIENDIIFMPEFLREATYLEDALDPDLIVVGLQNKKQRAFIDQLLKGYQCPKFFVSLETASLLKLTLNSFLATKISFFNEIKEICDSIPNANAQAIFEICARSKHTTDGSWGVYGGRPYGGKCLPKDVRALIAISNSELLKSVRAINDKMESRLGVGA